MGNSATMADITSKLDRILLAVDCHNNEISHLQTQLFSLTLGIEKLAREAGGYGMGGGSAPPPPKVDVVLRLCRGRGIYVQQGSRQ